ncbi:MAG: hypothetical protein AUJ98_04660 [Bacteroidetes bacterium CG2_30_33_31]|nr:MAG: hypothetical protein AUJ98_04660 [Bacteroidetes bacterium CG2_30_33_31]
MKRLILIFGIIIFSGINYRFIVPQDPYRITVVVIDAGHGGHDPGALGKNSKEKNIALNVALKFGHYIELNFKDVKVIFTRQTDEFIELYRRAQIANQANADLFISIHCNSNESSKASGTEAWIMGLHKSSANLRVAQTENASILLEANHDEKYNNFNPNSPASYISFSLFQSAFRDQSIDFATKVESEFKTNAQRLDRGVKEAGFLVLWKTAMPAILIETGFISNAEEEKYLNSEQGQNQLAASIFKAFKKYKFEMEGERYQKSEEKNSTKDANIITQENKTNTDVTNNISKPNNLNSDIIFGVQFATTSDKKPASSASFKGIDDMWNYYHSGFYKYVSGRYDSIEKAAIQLSKIRELGFSDAFVVAFIGGKRISPNEAMNILKNQADKK